MSDFDPMQVADASRDLAAMVVGMRSALVNEGFSEEGAELIVVSTLTQETAQNWATIYSVTARAQELLQWLHGQGGGDDG